MPNADEEYRINTTTRSITIAPMATANEPDPLIAMDHREKIVARARPKVITACAA